MSANNTDVFTYSSDKNFNFAEEFRQNLNGLFGIIGFKPEPEYLHKITQTCINKLDSLKNRPKDDLVNSMNRCSIYIDNFIRSLNDAAPATTISPVAEKRPEADPHEQGIFARLKNVFSSSGDKPVTSHVEAVQKKQPAKPAINNEEVKIGRANSAVISLMSSLNEVTKHIADKDASRRVEVLNGKLKKQLISAYEQKSGYKLPEERKGRFF